MKLLLLFPGVFFLIISLVNAQEQEEEAPVLSDTFAIKYDSLYPAERVVYKMFDIQKPPAFPGGEKELLKYLAENIKYPAVDRNNYPPSSMAVTFIVEADGSISTKKILRGGKLAQVLIDVLDKMPRWLPGMKNGEPVAVQFTLPIRCIKWE